MGLWGYDMGASISASSARQSTVNERNLNLLRASSIVMFGVMKCGIQIDTLTTPFRPNPCPPSHPLPSDPIQYQQLVRHGSIFLPDLRMPSSLAIQACPFITIPYLRIQPSHVPSPSIPMCLSQAGNYESLTSDHLLPRNWFVFHRHRGLLALF